MKKKAIFLGHQGYGGITRNANEIRECGYEPFIITSKLIIPREKFDAAMKQMELSYFISDRFILIIDEVLAALPEPIEHYAFCLSIWEGQRMLVAMINELISANDIAPQLIALIQNKYALRKKLFKLGLTKFDAYSYQDLQDRKDELGSATLFVKPRCSTGSMFSKKVQGASTAMALMRNNVPYHDDIFFTEFYKDIQLYAEPYIEGQEFSFEMVVHEGKVEFCSVHEKLRVAELSSTVLELSFCSPPIGIDEKAELSGQEKIALYFNALGITEGCYHVELRFHTERGWELIEINPRTGGGLIYDSVVERHGVKMISQWVMALTRKSSSYETRSPTKGTYFQIAYVEPGQQVVSIIVDDTYSEPVVIQKVLDVGEWAPIADREVFGAFSMWTTHIANHQDLVKQWDAGVYMKYKTATAVNKKESENCK